MSHDSIETESDEQSKQPAVQKKKMRTTTLSQATTTQPALRALTSSSNCFLQAHTLRAELSKAQQRAASHEACKMNDCALCKEKEEALTAAVEKVDALKRANIRLQAQIQRTKCISPKVFAERGVQISKLEAQLQVDREQNLRLKKSLKISQDRVKKKDAEEALAKKALQQMQQQIHGQQVELQRLQSACTAKCAKGGEQNETEKAPQRSLHEHQKASIAGHRATSLSSQELFDPQFGSSEELQLLREELSQSLERESLLLCRRASAHYLSVPSIFTYTPEALQATNRANGGGVECSLDSEALSLTRSFSQSFSLTHNAAEKRQR